MKTPIEYILVDASLQNLRRKVLGNAINWFKLEFSEGPILYTTVIDDIYEKFHQKACRKFENGCDCFVKNCPGMENEIVSNKPEHLQKLKDDLKEFKDAMEKVYELKKDENFERLMS